MLDDYKEGVIKAVTGTSGSALERREAKSLGMRFIDVPRHMGMFRKDRAIRLTANSKQQLDAIIQEILEGIAKKQPLLIISWISVIRNFPMALMFSH